MININPPQGHSGNAVTLGSNRREKMTTHTITTRDEWLEARLDLLAAEKDLTRRSDEVARLRQRLPWVRADKVYRFDTDKGGKMLKDLFGGRRRLQRHLRPSGKS